MKRNNLFQLACLFTLVCIMACDYGAQTSRSQIMDLSGSIIPVKVDKPYYVDKFSNLFSDVQYVALEETRNSILGTISKLEITKNGDYIVFDIQSGAVYRFASDGSFLNNIGFRGPGEKEYKLALDMVYDPFYDMVLIWDNGRSAILAYSLDGKLEYKIQLPWFIDKLGVVDMDYLVCYMNNTEGIRNGEKGTNYKIIRRDGTIEREYGEYGIEMAEFNPASRGFSFQHGRCLHLPPFSSSLYQVNRDSLSTIVTFDLLENAIPHEWLCGSHRVLRKKLSEHPDFVEISSVYETDEYYFLNLTKNSIAVLCVIQKNTYKTKSLAANLLNDMYGKVGNTCLTYAYDNKLYFTVDPLMFEDEAQFLHNVPEGYDMKRAILKNKDAIYSSTAAIFGAEAAIACVDSIESCKYTLSRGEREFIDEMSKKSNPVIQICTLK